MNKKAEKYTHPITGTQVSGKELILEFENIVRLSIQIQEEKNKLNYSYNELMGRYEAVRQKIESILEGKKEPLKDQTPKVRIKSPKKKTAIQAIVDLAKEDQSQTVSKKAVQEKLHLTPSVASQRIHRAVQAGLIEKIKQGVYKLTHQTSINLGSEGNLTEKQNQPISIPTLTMDL